MYRYIVPSLIALSTLLLLGIIGIIVWQDYQWHGSFSAGRALGSAGGRLAEIPSLAVGSLRSDEPLPANSPTKPDAMLGPGETAPQAASVPPTSSPEELFSLRQFMLELINTDRARYGLAPLILGDNPAAQWHADDMMRHNYRSHWDTDGLAPYMRYTLAGGHNRELQNVSGPDVLTHKLEGRGESPGELLTRTQEILMAGLDHRANILNRWHRKVNLGIACNDSTCWVVQQFESDHLRFSDLPSLSGGMLSFAGELDGGLEFDSAAVWYHQPFRPLTLGQLDATYSYGNGQYPATFLRPQPANNRYYPGSVSTYGWTSGIDPYTLEPGLARIDAPPLRVDVAQSRAVPWTNANLWEVSGSVFRVEADVALILEASGPGVYTVQIWAKAGEERVAVTNYSIFVD